MAIVTRKNVVRKKEWKEGGLLFVLDPWLQKHDL